jgi:hypothetical protein
MSEDKKVAKLGETVYLDETESFEDVAPPSPEEVEEEIEEILEEIENPESVEELAESLLKKNKEEEITFSLGDVSSEIEVDIDLDSLVEDVVDDDEPVEVFVEKKEPKKAKKIDLSKIKTTTKNQIDKERDISKALYGGKSAFQIVAAQSGYMAKVLPLVHKDQVNLYYSNLSFYEYKKAVYRVIWEKIHDTSVGKIQWEDWLRSTSVEDLETFYYGVYASTFPNEGSFRFSCPSPDCGEEHDYKINHMNLIKTTDKETMRKLIDEVSKNATTLEKMREYSLIGKNEAVQLNQSGIVVEIRTPSLFDSLEILRTVPEKTINKDVLTITNLLYIEKVYIPTKEDKSIFTEETNKTAILKIIDSLPIDDASELQDAVLERVENNRISYSIKNIKCPTCGYETKEIPISVEDILFTLIFEKTQ